MKPTSVNKFRSGVNVAVRSLFLPVYLWLALVQWIVEINSEHAYEWESKAKSCMRRFQSLLDKYLPTIARGGGGE